MPSTTLSGLRTAVRSITDTVDSLVRVTDAELNVFLGYAYRDYISITTDSLNHVWVATTSVTATGTSSGYALSHHFRVVAVEQQVGTNWILLKRLHHLETGRQPAHTAGSDIGYTIEYPYYATQATAPKLYLWPSATTGTFRVRYVADMPALEDVTAYYFPNNWDEFVVLKAALWVMAKEGRDNIQVKELFQLADERIRREIGSLDGFQKPQLPVINWGTLDQLGRYR